MAKYATGIVLNIAKPSAVTLAVALANIPLEECSASDQSIGRAINMCACSWSKPSGVCCLLKWQSGWHARQKYLARLKHGASLKKKIAVALARQLAIDLWRWRTGRATAAELGWTLKNAIEETTPL